MSQVALPLLAWLGLVRFALLAPLIAGTALAIYTPLAVALSVAVKRTLVGRYRAGHVPVWGAFYLRHWIVLRTLRLVPWRLLEGTEFQLVALRALGARIGRRVHLHRGVDLLHGGWDLLDIDDDVTISPGRGRAGVAPRERRARPRPGAPGCGRDAGRARERRPRVTGRSPRPAHRVVVAAVGHGGSGGRAVGRHPCAARRPRTRASGGDARGDAVADGLRGGVRNGSTRARLAVGGVDGRDARTRRVARTRRRIAVVGHPRAPRNGGRRASWCPPPSPCWCSSSGCPCSPWRYGASSPPPDQVVSRWSVGYVRVWLSTGMLRAAGEWLSGTLFWPQWLRLAGMQVGRGCEISTIIDVVASHVRIGGRVLLRRRHLPRGPARVPRHRHAGDDPHRLGHLPRQPRDRPGRHSGCRPASCSASAQWPTPAVDREGSSWFGHPARSSCHGASAWTRTAASPTIRRSIRYVNRLVWELAQVRPAGGARLRRDRLVHGAEHGVELAAPHGRGVRAGDGPRGHPRDRERAVRAGARAEVGPAGPREAGPPPAVVLLVQPLGLPLHGLGVLGPTRARRARGHADAAVVRPGDGRARGRRTRCSAAASRRSSTPTCCTSRTGRRSTASSRRTPSRTAC